MCGRYTLASAEDLSDFEDIINEIQRNETARNDILQGDIYPTDLAPVLVPENRMVLPKLVVWGFPGFKGKGVIINARAETAPAKPLFSGALSYGRCVIPSTGFFEWDKRTKQKYQFNLPNSRALYMAGLVREFEGQRRFVILTTSANESMQDIHDRMPVILKKTMWKPGFTTAAIPDISCSALPRHWKKGRYKLLRLLLHLIHFWFHQAGCTDPIL